MSQASLQVQAMARTGGEPFPGIQVPGAGVPSITSAPVDSSMENDYVLSRGRSFFRSGQKDLR